MIVRYFVVFFLFVAIVSCKKVQPTCFDGIKNNDEEEIDCGGICPPCAYYPLPIFPCTLINYNTNYLLVNSDLISLTSQAILSTVPYSFEVRNVPSVSAPHQIRFTFYNNYNSDYKLYSIVNVNPVNDDELYIRITYNGVVYFPIGTAYRIGNVIYFCNIMIGSDEFYGRVQVP